MTGYLIDTSVLSALAPGRAEPAARGWFIENDGALYLSVVVLSEIRQGIAKLERLGAARKAAALSRWFEETLQSFADALLPVDVPAALAAGILSDKAKAAGTASGYPDILIAATAQRHGLTIATRNIRHFRPLGVACLDPFAGGTRTRRNEDT